MHRHSCLQLCRTLLRGMSSLVRAQGFEPRIVVFGNHPDQLAKKGLPCLLENPVRCHRTALCFLAPRCSLLSKAFASTMAGSSGRVAVAYSEASAFNSATAGDKAPHVPVLLQEASLCYTLRNARLKAGVWQPSAATARIHFHAGHVQLRRVSCRDICGWHSGRWRALCSPHTRSSRTTHLSGHRQRPNCP